MWTNKRTWPLTVKRTKYFWLFSPTQLLILQHKNDREQTGGTDIQTMFALVIRGLYPRSTLINIAWWISSSKGKDNHLLEETDITE